MTQKSVILLTIAVCYLSFSTVVMAASISTSTLKPDNSTATANATNANMSVTTTTPKSQDSRMVDIGHDNSHGNSSMPTTTLAPSTNSTKGDLDEDRKNRQYVSLGPGLSGPFNPFPAYIDPRLGGFTGPGVSASSCAYAYPNRRYSCYGLGRKK